MKDKEFSQWNILKPNIHLKNKKKYFYEKEIWFLSLGINIGDEEDGKGDNFLRPILIFKKFNPKIFIGISLSSKFKKGKYYYNFISTSEISTTAILSQIRLLDAKRLKYKKGKITNKDFLEIKKRLGKILDIF